MTGCPFALAERRVTAAAILLELRIRCAGVKVRLKMPCASARRLPVQADSVLCTSVASKARRSRTLPQFLLGALQFRKEEILLREHRRLAGADR